VKGGGLANSRAYARVRGAVGVAFIIFGVLIGYQIVSKYGLGLNTISGLVLSIAMIVLGYVRIRGAIAAGKPPK
jgi:hypothetical protein